MNQTPAFYDADRIGTLFYPDSAAISRAAAAANLPPAANDARNIHLVLVDMQVDFCHAQGNLYVPGAPGDIRRVCDFILRYADKITQITATLDSHLPYQIFHPAWWVDDAGNHPAPYTLITYADVQAGRWRAVVAPDYSADYTRRLEQNARKVLTIWPYHVQIGSLGSGLDPMLWSVVQWHALARRSQPTWAIKGTLPQTEHYSAIKPEIEIAGRPALGLNSTLLERLESSDIVIVAGEAESHCVLATLEDIVTHFGADTQRLRNLYVLRDCMSPVQHPAIDFHALALEAFAALAARGVNFIDSTADDLPFMDVQHTIGDDPAVRGVELYL